MVHHPIEDETYRGTAAFSEPEIAAMRDFCESHEFKGALNYHTYANLLLYAWGWSRNHVRIMICIILMLNWWPRITNLLSDREIRQFINTNGGSDDWMYGEQTTKERFWLYSLNWRGGWWILVPSKQDHPIAQEIWYKFIFGSFAEVCNCGRLTQQSQSTIHRF